jgi:hypothetical protein
MQRGAVPRCRGAPNGSCITQTLGCGKTQYDPGQDQGSNFDPSCQVGFKWDDDLPLPGSERRQLKNISADRMIALRRNSYGGDGEERDAVVPRADGSPFLQLTSCPHTLASRPAALNTTDKQYQPGAEQRFSTHRG